MSVPSIPAAPGRLSTTTCWLHASASFWPKRRVMKSVPPPGANGTMNLIGLIGYSVALCADAAAAGHAHRSTAAMARLQCAGIIARRSNRSTIGMRSLRLRRLFPARIGVEPEQPQHPDQHETRDQRPPMREDYRHHGRRAVRDAEQKHTVMPGFAKRDHQRERHEDERCRE